MKKTKIVLCSLEQLIVLTLFIFIYIPYNMGSLLSTLGYHLISIFQIKIFKMHLNTCDSYTKNYLSL